MVASNTEMKVKNAEKVAALDRLLNVRGNEKTKEITAVTTDHTMVQVPPFVIVLRYFAPTRQWRPWKSLEYDRKIISTHKAAYLNEGVVQQEHDCRQPPNNLRIPEQILANIANITDFWMAQTELPIVVLALQS